MPSLRQIRGRLRSTQSMKQIMRAMQLVSASKLKRAHGRLLQSRLVLEFLDGLIARLLGSGPPVAHPLCASRGEGANALVLFTSDAGLCGAYNANLMQLAESSLRREGPRATQVIYIGKKGFRYFTKRGFAAAESFLGLAGRPDLANAEAIGRALMQRFLDGRAGSVDLLYSRYVSPMVYRPAVTRWLPITLSAQHAAHSAQRTPVREQEYIVEPSAQRVFDDLLPRWALAAFQRALLEAFTSEHSARMIAMKNATDNSETLIGELTMQRNKIRQASITKELSEIVGTAEALK